MPTFCLRGLFARIRGPYQDKSDRVAGQRVQPLQPFHQPHAVATHTGLPAAAGHLHRHQPSVQAVRPRREQGLRFSNHSSSATTFNSSSNHSSYATTFNSSSNFNFSTAVGSKSLSKSNACFCFRWWWWWWCCC